MTFPLTVPRSPSSSRASKSPTRSRTSVNAKRRSVRRCTYSRGFETSLHSHAVLPRQESLASLHIRARRASEGSEAFPSLARRVRMSFFGARVINKSAEGTTHFLVPGKRGWTPRLTRRRVLYLSSLLRRRFLLVPAGIGTVQGTVRTHGRSIGVVGPLDRELLHQRSRDAEVGVPQAAER